MTKSKYILAHDTGTGGDKAVLCNLNGKVLYSAYQAYGLSYPQAEWVEQDPDELWRTAVERKGGRFALLAGMPFDPNLN